MIFVKHNNPGFTALLKLAYDCEEPYEDVLRSTNVKEFTLDTSLDRKPEFVPDKPIGS